jgi:hypothetical protein
MGLDEFLLGYVQRSPQHRVFYHFTDSRNIASIRQRGLWSTRRLRESGVEIPAPGGNEWSQDADESCGMDAFVHLCFTKGHPMAHLAVQDGRIQNLQYIPVRPDVIKLPGVMLTDAVANKSGVIPGRPGEMLDQLDLAVIYTWTDWRNPAVNARLQAADRYEILVPDCVPRSYLLF